MKHLSLIVALFSAFPVHGCPPAEAPAAVAPAPEDDPRMRAFFRALSAVESGHDDSAVGDGGRSIGRYQIGRAYWADSRVPGVYEDVRRAAYAERVMLAYWRRYCPAALEARDWETLARVHNGGPRGYRKAATATYWRKVREAMGE